MARRCGWWLVAALAAAAVLAGPARAQDKVKVLIVDGQNGHDWKATTPVLKDMLEKTGRFTVDVATSPEKGAAADAWAAFKPDFAAYGAVVTNYCGQPWPEPVRQAFEKYVADGGGLVVYHFAVAAFPEWEAYNKMIGQGWKRADFGASVALDDEGKVVRRAKGEGPGAGHGPMHPFEVRVRDAEHPVTKGLPAKWQHTTDELYHGQRGPAQDMHILATAFSAPEKKGTGLHEPMAWTVPFGKGRVFVNLLGHHVVQLTAPGCAALTVRGTEWAATGKVTIPAPASCDSPATP